jgi:hypothetical protein
MVDSESSDYCAQPKLPVDLLDVSANAVAAELDADTHNATRGRSQEHEESSTSTYLAAPKP